MWPFLALAVTLSSPIYLMRRARDATKPGWHPDAAGWTKRPTERPARPLLRGELTSDWWAPRRSELSHDVWASARAELGRPIEVTPFKRDPGRREFLLRDFDGRQTGELPRGDPRRKTRPRHEARHGAARAFRGAP